MQAKPYADAAAAGVSAVVGKGELMGINIHNDHTSLTDVTLDDSTDGTGKILWKGRVAADTEITEMLNDGKGRGITFSVGVYLTTSNVTNVDVVIYH